MGQPSLLQSIECVCLYGVCMAVIFVCVCVEGLAYDCVDEGVSGWIALVHCVYNCVGVGVCVAVTVWV